jgi:flagellar motor component MotA
MALYWSIISITTMGYGDILPVTNEERLFVIFVAVVGAVVFSYTMGTLTQLVTSSSNAEMAFDAQLSR